MTVRLQPLFSLIRFICLLGSVTLLIGCAATKGPPDERDPFESFNRAMFKFNDAVDTAVVRPVAEAYQENVPQPVQTGVSNFFSNLDDIFVLINDLLQFKFKQAASDFSRLVWNSTVGLFGLIDVATPMGLPKHDEDFGQTLATWGVGDGPYLVLPFLGPSTVRDTGGLVVELAYDPLREGIEDDEAYWAAFAVRVIDARAKLLGASRILDEAALDPYVFMRDAYLQNRRNLIYDGNPPEEKIDIDAGDTSDEDLELELELELEDKKTKSGN